MTTGAQEVTTVDELQLRFVGGGGVVEGPLTPQGSYAERGRPMTTGAHSGGDDRGRASTSFSWRRRSCWRIFDPQGSYAERGRPMTTGAQEVTTVDELQLRFLGGGGVVGGFLTLTGRTLRGDAR